MLTEEKRKEYCVREATQAVVHALGGSVVYRLAVAPLGAQVWEIESRKGMVKKGIFSDCQTSARLRTGDRKCTTYGCVGRSKSQDGEAITASRQRWRFPSLEDAF